MNTGIGLTITRWSTSSRLRSVIHAHSPSSTRSRWSSSSTRAALPSTTSTRERPKSRRQAQRVDADSRSALSAKLSSCGPTSPFAATAARYIGSASSSSRVRLPMCWYSQ